MASSVRAGGGANDRADNHPLVGVHMKSSSRSSPLAPDPPNRKNPIPGMATMAWPVLGDGPDCGSGDHSKSWSSHLQVSPRIPESPSPPNSKPKCREGEFTEGSSRPSAK